MAGTTGLEPATSDVTGRRSNQLNYVPFYTWINVGHWQNSISLEHAELTSLSADWLLFLRLLGNYKGPQTLSTAFPTDLPLWTTSFGNGYRSDVFGLI